jgi:hypothetical protein
MPAGIPARQSKIPEHLNVALGNFSDLQCRVSDGADRLPLVSLSCFLEFVESYKAVNIAASSRLFSSSHAASMSRLGALKVRRNADSARG